MIVFGVQEAESTSNNWWTFDNYYKRKNFERTDWKKERINVKAVPQLTTNANDFEKKRIVKNKKENDFQKMWNDAWITKDIYSDSLKYSSRRVINILSKLWAVTSWPWGSKMKLKIYGGKELLSEGIKNRNKKWINIFFIKQRLKINKNEDKY